MMAWHPLTYILIAISVTSSSAATKTPVTTTTATKTAVTPATATHAPVTPATATHAPVTPAPVTKAPGTPIIPNTFYYNCTANGGIQIMNVNNSMSNVIVQNINKSSSNCSDPTKGTDGSITVDNCTQNATVTIVLEAAQTKGILGGLHSKTFQIKCEDVNIKPYLLTVTAKPNIGDQLTQQVVHMVTNPTPTHLQSLDMVIKVANKSVEKAFIGQKLVIAIKVPATASIKPTVCDATGNGKNVTLWQETGCKHDEELFGEKWTNKSGEVRNTMYGFRFVGSSTSITITCTVRVCPDGYKGHDCDLSTCGSRKRKRITRLPEAVTIQKATTTLTIRDPLLTSGAGRKAHELNIIIGIALATVGLLKITFFQG